MSKMADDILNVLSVDVEDYHNQLALDFLGRIVPPNVEAVRCTERLLEVFAEHQVRGTFFILGEIAEHFPELVRRIGGAGHHLGVHGYHHHLVFNMGQEEFRSAAERAKKRIEDLCGRAADAYRATAFSISRGRTPWAWSTLVDLGFKYDSSVFPFAGRRYGDANAPREPFRIVLPDGRLLWEIPMSTAVGWGRRWPVGGGGYLRLAPMWLTDRAIRSLHHEGRGLVVYLHPYETEPAPRIDPLSGLSLKKMLHFYFFNFHQQVNRAATSSKLHHLLSRYHFAAIDDVVRDTDSQAAPTIPYTSLA